MRARSVLTVALIGLVAGGVAYASGRWDGSFERRGQLTTTAPTSGNVAVPAGSYVKVRCDVAAYLGHGVGSGTACTATTCEPIAAGDAYYAQLLPSEDYVAGLAVAGSATCQVFRSRN